MMGLNLAASKNLDYHWRYVHNAFQKTPLNLEARPIFVQVTKRVASLIVEKRPDWRAVLEENGTDARPSATKRNAPFSIHLHTAFIYPF
jgi:hypothetical protein